MSSDKKKYSKSTRIAAMKKIYFQRMFNDMVKHL